MADPQRSFEAHRRSAIVLARDNLAEVALFRLQTRRHETDLANTWHLVGNLVIAACAAAETDEPPARLAADALATVGADAERSQHNFQQLLTRSVRREIFALQHIPSGAPEIHETAHSRELRVAEFIRQAHMLKPDAPEPVGPAGSGKLLFLGTYQRRVT